MSFLLFQYCGQMLSYAEGTLDADSMLNVIPSAHTNTCLFLCTLYDGRCPHAFGFYVYVVKDAAGQHLWCRDVGSLVPVVRFLNGRCLAIPSLGTCQRRQACLLIGPKSAFALPYSTVQRGKPPPMQHSYYTVALKTDALKVLLHSMPHAQAI